VPHESDEEDAAAERVVRIAPERLGRWLNGFAERHGAISVAADAFHVTVGGSDGASAVITVTFPPLPSSSDPITALLAHASRERQVGALLVRKGGYAVGVFSGRRLIRSKVGSAYVQGRTKAGGWSQQRFARRRGHQTDAVVAHAVETAVRVLLPHAGTVEALFTGGDRGLTDEVLADPRLATLAALRREPALDVGEPTKAVLLETPGQFRAVGVHIVEPTDR
jgi:hypothetical protein